MSDRVIVILGASGQLGSELAGILSKDWTVKAYTHQNVEITDTSAVERLIGSERPFAVINCAAYNQVEGAESDPVAAFAINGIAPESLARACRRFDSLLVHFSSDYVFDGELGRPYTEEDVPAPLNVYGRSKLAGEEAIRLLHPRHLIFRVTGLYGRHRSPRGKPNFVESIIAKAKVASTLSVHSDLVCTPTSARQAAISVSQTLEREAIGTFHLTNSGSCSWFEFANEIVRQSSLPCEIVPVPHSSGGGLALRPQYTAMSNAKLHAAGVRPLPAWQAAVSEYLRSRAL